MESGFFEKLDQAYFNDFISEGPDFDIENSVGLKDSIPVSSCSNDVDDGINWLDDDDFIKSDFLAEDFEKTYKEWERHLTSLRKAQEPVPESSVDLVEEEVEVVSPSTDVVVADAVYGANGETTDHLGPDNYEVVEIKVEDEDDCMVEIVDANSEKGKLKTKENAKRSAAKKNKSKKKIQMVDKQSDHNYCSDNVGGRSQLKPLPEEYDAFSVTEEDRWALEKENAGEEVAVVPPPPSATTPSSGAVCHVARKNEPSSWYKNPKKDSGLESGEVSDASESPLSLTGSQQGVGDAVAEDAPKKKKLNLDEYRTRRKFNRAVSPRKFGSIAEAILTKEWAKGSSLKQSKKPDNGVLLEDRLAKCEAEEDRAKEKLSSEEGERRSRRRRRSSSSSSGSSRSRSRRPRRRSYRSRSTHRNRTRSTSSESSSSRSKSGSSRRSRRRNRSRSRSDYKYRPSRRYSEDRLGEKQKQIEERRVVFVGQIEDGVTKAQLKERFKVFGPIVDISLHFRDRGDNYGFVTYAHKADAYQAVEHGNDNPLEPRYDICFGGRRAFCRQRYADLDSMGPQQGYSPYLAVASPVSTPLPRAHVSFDALLREAQEKLRKQKQQA